MQKDFHYCIIKILAEKAGFESDEAQIIAYASQYVDDAVEHQKIRIKNLPNEISSTYPRVDHEEFDPICTAHKGIQYIIGGISKEAQRKVYISFHFIPSEEYVGKGAYSFCAIPNGRLAGNLVGAAINELKKSKGKGKEKRTQNLIKLGIALHSFSDTWSHQKFSGRKSMKDNNIERIEIFKDGNFESFFFSNQPLLNKFWSFFPIGHGEAYSIPDFSHIKWKYEHDFTGIPYERDNTSFFLEAANVIFSMLSEASEKLTNWKNYVNRIKECLCFPTDSIKEKFKRYNELFPEVKNLNYNEDEWKSLALKGDVFNWIDFDKDDYALVKYTYNGDLKWFYFHVEALKQREYVMSKIKYDLI